MRKGAIILCGGKSSRMGRDKATLPFGTELMLPRIVRLLGEVIDLDALVVVAAPQQVLPELPGKVFVSRDALPFRGPLEGLASGIRAFADQKRSAKRDPVDAIYATGCDVPLLVPAFVERMFELLGDFDIAVPFDGRHYHPLASIYRPSVLPHVELLLASQRLRPSFLFDEVHTREIPVDDLRGVDPQLSTLANVNFEQDYRAALKMAGISSKDS
jgi:molybdopterin-guanine dinucleotide biosynthesis protein A